MTTGDFTSVQLLEHEAKSAFEYLDNTVAQTIGEKALGIALDRNFPITISIQLDGEEVFRRALPGASDEHASWIARKLNVVNKTHHSTMYERVKAEEDGVDWYQEHNVDEKDYAIHGGGFPLLTTAGEFRGVLLISGLPQVEDHLFAYELLSAFGEAQRQG